MRDVGKNLEIPLFVFGPETHMTAIVAMALEKREVPGDVPAESSTANFLLPGSVSLTLSLWGLTTAAFYDLIIFLSGI